MLSLALLSSAIVKPAAPPRVAARCAAVRACEPIEVEVVDSTFDACMKMKIPEIKAELELRGVPEDASSGAKPLLSAAHPCSPSSSVARAARWKRACQIRSRSLQGVEVARLTSR